MILLILFLSVFIFYTAVLSCLNFKENYFCLKQSSDFEIRLVSVLHSKGFIYQKGVPIYLFQCSSSSFCTFAFFSFSGSRAGGGSVTLVVLLKKRIASRRVLVNAGRFPFDS